MIRRTVNMNLSPAELKEAQAGQITSRRVTKHGREYECKWCVSGPRRRLSLLVQAGLPNYQPKKSL